MAPPSPIPGLTPLTPAISYLRQAHNSNFSGISLVLLCTWMGAGRKPIAKYVEQHRRLYPDADILVAESRLDHALFWTESKRQKSLESAREIVLEHHAAHARGESGGILLHAFSNEGGQCSTLLTLSLPVEVRTKVWTAVVFDSCPGDTHHWATINAMKLSLPPSPMMRTLALPFIHLVLCFIIARSACGLDDIVVKVRKRANNAELFDRSVPRLYLYSKEDVMVGWRDVQLHAEEARAKGWEVVEKREFEGSLHCAHAMKFKEVYWETLAAFVNGALLR